MDLIAAYHGLTLSLSRETGASDAILHFHAGLALLVIARFALRRPLASWLPFLFVVALAIANEAIDALGAGEIAWSDTLGDLGSSLFWPLVLSAAARVGQQRGGPRPAL